MEKLAGEVGRALRGRQEYVTRCNLMRLRCPPHWCLAPKIHYHFERQGCQLKWGPHGSRSDAVEPNSLLHQLECQAPRESHNGSLGAAVVQQGRCSRVSSDGR
ncbi:hypothetical protein SLA2020_096890 [Shorea laevis]